MSVSDDLKSRILSAVSIESYIGRYVNLKKQGRHYKGLCPFHPEKTPSFTVAPDKGLFYCFGCGAGGDIFSFVMKKENVDFAAALEILRVYAGIEALPGSKTDPEKERLFKVNEIAGRIFHNYFVSPEGRESMDYMLNRGIRKETLDEFLIGASSDRWTWLAEQMPGHRADMMTLGLLKESSGRAYDFFRDRIIFPIRDAQGRIAGFGGRIYRNADNNAHSGYKPSKYINSNESPVFSKSRILYGLWHALSAVRSRRKVYITEGYLDVIGFHQSGIKNTVAPLGTSLTESHIQILQRYADQAVLVLDGDRAGRAAALRASEIIVREKGLSGSVVFLPEGMDPFDLSKILPETALRSMLEQCAVPAERFLLMETIWPGFFSKAVSVIPEKTLHPEDPAAFASAVKRLYTENSANPYRDAPINEKMAAVSRAAEYLKKIPAEIDQDLYVQEAAAILNVSASGLAGKLISKNYKNSKVLTPGKESAQGTIPTGDKAGTDPQIITERKLIMELVRHPYLLGMYHHLLKDLDFEDHHSMLLFRFLEARYQMGQTWDYRILYTGSIPQESAAVFTGILLAGEADAAFIPEKNHAEYMDDLILDQKIRSQKKKIRRSEEAMRFLSGEDYNDALTVHTNLVKELKELESEKSRSRSQ